jgi:tRNA pseudouridine38-40 synthase
LGQIASVDLTCTHDAATLHRALNVVLPAAVRVLDVAEAPPDFHARFSAVCKVYEYRIVNALFVSAFLHRYVLHVPFALDIERMREASRALVGPHDFAAFQGAGSIVSSTTRTIHSLEWTGGGSYDRPLVMRVEGDGFLRHMVRNIVGTLIEVGAARISPARVREILESGDRRQAGPTAPAAGLFLVAVRY